MISADIVIKAQFYDLDPMEVVWHGNYVRFLEQARCALLDKIQFNYAEMAATPYVWPIVDLRIKYVRPIRFAQTVKVTAILAEYENRIRINYLLVDHQSGEILTRAHTIQVAVERQTNEICFESPSVLRDRVRRCL